MTQSSSFRTSTATINYEYQDDQEQPHPQSPMQDWQGFPPQEETKRPAEQQGEEFDATQTIGEMHRKLLYLMSNPELFHDALDWLAKIEKGLDPSLPPQDASRDQHGMKRDDGEKEALELEKYGDEARGGKSVNDDNQTLDIKYPAQHSLIPPLPLQIFTADAEVVLPEAMTASQLFGIERVTGIELEAAAGIEGLSALFLRWLALMPEGDHMNTIDPPGLTVMRIFGGRYRVTGSHRVVWRWMNKFSPASAFAQPRIAIDEGEHTSEMAADENEEDSDFDFGDLVTMTIIDVFETDGDGKLLSYCPTFDNRAVRKTQEVVERVMKGASHLKERMDVVVRSPTGQKCLKAASHFGMRKYTQALTVGSIVKHKIEEEFHKRQGKTPSETSLDAVAGTDVADEQDEEEEVATKVTKVDNAYNSAESTSALQTILSEAKRMETSGEGYSKRSKNEYYFSDDSTAATPQQSQEFV